VVTSRKTLVAVNERGCRIGQDHPRAKFSDHEIELMRRLHEEHGFGYRRIAAKFNASFAYAGRVCRYLVRNQTPARFKRGG
jgi:hypothetical protein